MAPTKVKAKVKTRSSHPSFYEMVSDAIATMKERSGSSQYAIQKFLEEKHKKGLPANFRRMLLVQLKRLVASGKLVKVKSSYKLSNIGAKKPKEKANVAKASEGKKAVGKSKRMSAVKSPAMMKAGGGSEKKAVRTPRKMKRLSAVKTPVKRVSARKVAK